MKKTKIIATLGPATESEENLIAMYQAGVNIIRFNFSHAEHDHSKMLADRIKKLNKEGETNFSLLLDTKGPEIRTGKVSEKITFQTGNIMKIYIHEDHKDPRGIFCDYPYIIDDLNIGDIIMIDSGLCMVKVIEKHANYLSTEVCNNCEIGSKRHINLPGVKLKLPGITEKDKQDILFAIQNDYDFIAMSFVRNKDNIEELKRFLAYHNASHIKIISKIENQEAIENLQEIVEYSDGIMVARGDLGIEVPIEKLPFYQKEIVNLCLEHGKFYIIATHLLETMIENPFPTRAEISDIYNSVLDLADCTMLSGETTTGKYPIQAIQMMKNVIQEAEKNRIAKHIDFNTSTQSKVITQKKHLVKSALELGKSINAKAILIFTQYGFLAKLAAAYKSDIDMFAITNNEHTFRFLNILYGISPILLPNFGTNYASNLDLSLEYLQKMQLINSKDKIILIGDTQKDGIEIPTIQIIDIQ